MSFNLIKDMSEVAYCPLLGCYCLFGNGVIYVCGGRGGVFSSK